MEAFKPRVEDDRLIRGTAKFVDDLRPARCLFGFFVRSPHAFAAIKSINIDGAVSHADVVAALTASDMKAALAGNVSWPMRVAGRDGAELKVPFRPALADDRVLHVGQPIALVIARTLAAAQDAADDIAVEYEILQPVVGVRQAVESSASQLWPNAPSNIAVDWPGPVQDDANEAEVARIIATAPHAVNLTLTNQRLVVASMETRGATADFNCATGTYTLRCGTQGAAALRD
jgi:carbon-monoxide dehydrogenase large subunit